MLASPWNGGGVKLFEAKVDGSFPVGVAFENRLNLPSRVYCAGVSTAHASCKQRLPVWVALEVRFHLTVLCLGCAFSRTLVKNEIVIEELMIFRRRKMKSELP